MMVIRKATVLFATLLVSNRLAFAHSRPSAGLSVGRTLGGVSEPRQPVFGVHAGMPLGGGFSGELGIFSLTDKPSEERFGVSVSAEQDLTLLHVSCRFNQPLRKRRLDVYVLAGLGYCFGDETDFYFQEPPPEGYVTQVGPMTVNRDGAWGIHMGLGVEWFLHDRFSAMFEYRYEIMDSDATIAGLSADSPEGQIAIDAFEKDFWDNNEIGSLRIGLNWRF